MNMSSSDRPNRPRYQKGFKPANPPAYDQYGQFSPGPQLFTDTSGGYAAPYPHGSNRAMGGWDQSFSQPSFAGEQLLSDPVAAMAMQYGQTIAGQGKVIVEEKLEKYISISKMKNYFAVDTGYVTKKLGLLFFPFTHMDWSMRFNNENEPVAPRYDINAPDLYIPTMAFVTYILTAGYILGSQNRFSPEQLGMQASSALGWSLVEICILFLALYVLSTSSSLKVLDLIAFCSYKYVCMVAALIACILFKTLGYYAVLGYSSLSLGFFLIRTLSLTKNTIKVIIPIRASLGKNYLAFIIYFLLQVTLSIEEKTMAYCGPTHYRPIAEWVPASGGSVPPNAIEVGYDGGDLLYVARAHHQGDNIPGKLVPAHGSCYVPYGGEEHGYHQYEVLVAPYGSNLEWRPAHGQDLPPGAVQGGSTADGEPLYVGRVSHEGAMCSGKVQPSHGVLYIAYGGGEHPHNTYDILCVRSVNF